ncbi:MAG: peptidase S8, partial [Flavobacterium sp.]|nr:peptidase S8 [Flavobacterium sp.]
MIKKILVIIIFTFSFIVQAQEDAWIYFNDKPDATTYLSNPLSMLTQRALDRRTDQGIALDNSDVPIAQTYINQVTAASGITVMAKSKWLNALHIRGSQSNIEALTSFPFVSSIEFANQTLNRSGRNAESSAISMVNKEMNVQVSYNYGNSA